MRIHRNIRISMILAMDCFYVRSVMISVLLLQKNVKRSGDCRRDVHTARAQRRNQTRDRCEPVNSHSKAFCSPDVLFTIVGKKQSLRGLSRRCNCGFIDPPVRLQRTDDVGKDLHVEVLKHGIVPFNVMDVGFIGIGDQN